MSASKLEKRLASHKIAEERERERQPQRTNNVNWPERFAAAFASAESGIQIQAPRSLILIDADSALKTPEDLQDLLGLPSPPRVTDTIRLEPWGPLDDVPTEREKIRVCDVHIEQLEMV